MGKTTKTKKSSAKIWFNVTNCRYPVIRAAARARKWKLVNSDDNDEHRSSSLEATLNKCNLHWIDTSDMSDFFRHIRHPGYQKINHFPGMSQIARKSRLARNLERMRKQNPTAFDFMPRTWTLPQDWSEFQTQFHPTSRLSLGRRTFIIKPDAGCQGRGVALTQDLAQVKARLESSDSDAKSSNNLSPLVVQRYIGMPYLLEGKKFDLRVYLLVLNASPLKVLLFQDGLVRLCSTDYVPPKVDNLQNTLMHLTNVAIQRHAVNYDNQEKHKRSIKWFLEHVTEEFDVKTATDLWTAVGDVCLKTVISIQPTLAREYASHFGSTEESGNSCCFEVLGFDILVDAQLKPWLIEVNHLPSFKTDSDLDQDVKTRLIRQTFDLLNLSEHDEQRYFQHQTKCAQERLYGGSPKVNTSSVPLKSTSLSFPLDPEELHALVVYFYSQCLEEPQAKAAPVDEIVRKYQTQQELLDVNLRIKYQRGLKEIYPGYVTQTQENQESPKALGTALPVDFKQLYPVPQDPARQRMYDDLLAQASKDINQLQMRLQAPLHQKRGGSMEWDSLPPLSTGTKSGKIPDRGRDCFGLHEMGKFRDVVVVSEKKLKSIVAVPRPEQMAAADRLMHGHSSLSKSALPILASDRMPAPSALPLTMMKSNARAVSNGLAYRKRMENLRKKPTLALNYLTFGAFD